MSSEKYKIITENKGINHVKTFKSDGNSYVNEWNFPLLSDDEPIVFKEFYTETKFAIVNWDGWIRLYDASTKETLLDYKLNGKINSSALLSFDKSKLYVAFTPNYKNSYLAILELSTYELSTVELRDNYRDSIGIRKDGCLLFYNHDSEKIDNIKVYRHFYSVLNLETQKLNLYELPFAPQFSFNNFKPAIDIKNNCVIFPALDEVVIKTNDNGETLFEYKIILIDLNTFEIQHILSVRDFPKNQLGCYDYNCESMANQFLSDERSKNYINALRDFHEDLNTIKVVPDGFWLCWRGGILRKINSDLSMSPLLVTSSIPRSTLKGIFTHHGFHSHLHQIDHSTIVFTDGRDFYKTSMPSLETADVDTPIALNLEETSLDELYNLSYSKKKKAEIKNRDKILIEVKDLSTKESFIDALTQMETMVSDLKALGIGKILLFSINDTKGNTLEEPEFFEMAIEYAPERMKAIIEKLIQNNKIKYIYRNSEQTVLCHAVFELAKKGDAYLTTVLQYLNAIDLDHDVFNTENLIPMLEEIYTVKNLEKKIKKVSSDLAEWYAYYREEI